MTSAEENRVAVVIEDDADIRNLLESVLSMAGFSVVTASNGLDGVEAVRENSPTVTTLDVSMPGIDGLETARRIRAFSQTYILMLTAHGEEIDVLQGLESGADDYVVKPFRPRELRARIEALLRRPRQVVGVPTPEATTLPPSPAPAAAPGTTASTPGAPAPAPVVMTAVPADDNGDWHEHNGLRLQPEMRLVELDGKPLNLTRTEFDLLAALLETGRRVRTKADLALQLRGEEYVTSSYVSETDKRTIEVHLANLRRKLGESAAAPRWIETVRGVGYRLTPGEA